MSEPETPASLDYERPPPPGNNSGVIVGNAIAAVLIGLAIGFVLYLNSISFGARRSPANISPLQAIAIFAAWFVLANAVALWLHGRPQSRSNAIGIWIGLGIVALIQGACFGSRLL